MSYDIYTNEKLYGFVSILKEERMIRNGPGIDIFILINSLIIKIYDIHDKQDDEDINAIEYMLEQLCSLLLNPYDIMISDKGYNLLYNATFMLL